MYTLTLLMILSTAQPAANNDAKSFLAPEPTYQNASPEIGDVGAAFRSAWAPGYGQFSKERPTQGIFVAFSTYGAAAFTAISTIIAFQQFDAFNNFTPPLNSTPNEVAEKVQNQLDAANAWRNVGFISGTISILAWGFGIIDAYTGKPPSEKDSLE